MILSKTHWFVYSPLVLAISYALAAAYRPLSLKSDILSDYSLITSDGFQWIMQGRALAQGIFDQTWPELRNPGYVLITALDAFLGSAGIAIALSIALALLIQIYVIYFFTYKFSKSHLAASLIALAMILSPIHFIALHVLSDAISVALMLLMLLFAFKTLNYQKIRFLNLFILSLATPLFQLYTLYPLLILIPFLFFLFFTLQDSEQRVAIRNTLVTILSGSFIGVSLRQLWYYLIPHESSPIQFGLINLSLNNMYFYLNTWAWLIGPIFFILLITFSFLRFNLKTKNLFSYYVTALFSIYGVSIFFYNWQESRFSYFLTVLSFIIFALTLSKVSSLGLVNLLSFSLAFLLLFFGSILTPTNKWAPEIGEYVYFRPWILHGFWGSPPYAEYINTKHAYCEDGKLQITLTEEFINQQMPLISRSDPALGKFALENCL
jgi:hypothetical protein